jgi:hypothetical protein
LKKRLSGNYLREKVDILSSAVREIQSKLQTEGKDDHG